MDYGDGRFFAVAQTAVAYRKCKRVDARLHKGRRPAKIAAFQHSAFGKFIYTVNQFPFIFFIRIAAGQIKFQSGIFIYRLYFYRRQNRCAVNMVHCDYDRSRIT